MQADHHYDYSKPFFRPGDKVGDRKGGRAFSHQAASDFDLAEMARVDHAGEFGATVIYKGQLAGAKEKPLADLDAQQAYIDSLEEMLKQEQQHLAWFEDYMIKNRVRPSLMMPLWERLGFALGKWTAKRGKESAMACTVAIESEIEAHYQEQINLLENAAQTDPALKDLYDHLVKFRNEELEHHDHAQAAGATSASLYPLLNKAIRSGALLSIALAKRL
ncbi:MAG: demethoxyubiquinone hydroxylase family protein [Alphaproteobacteria bacterium]